MNSEELALQRNEKIYKTSITHLGQQENNGEGDQTSNIRKRIELNINDSHKAELPVKKYFECMKWWIN